MGDLIRREDVDKAIQSICDLCGEDKKNNGVMCGACNLDSFIREYEDLPSAEPEPKIIHCKDCKFYTPMNRILKTGICSMTMHHLGDDGFCSTAEKRGKNA